MRGNRRLGGEREREGKEEKRVIEEGKKRWDRVTNERRKKKLIP